MLNDTQIAQLLEISLAGSRTGQVLPARDICAAILAVRPGFMPARIALAFSHIVLDEFEEARVLLNDVLTTAPADSDALVMLGLLETLSDHKEEARTALNAVCKDAAREDAPHVLMAKALLAHID